MFLKTGESRLAIHKSSKPVNSAGKPLRIKLATRLGLGCLSDSTPLAQRHFEAQIPDAQASLSEPIQCTRVSCDVAEIERALLNIHGVHDVAARCRDDGAPEAFVAASGVESRELKDSIAGVLPGYMIPDPLHVLSGLHRDAAGNLDFAAMEAQIAEVNEAAMSEQLLLVRDIVANLLMADATKITGKSDFFLLGGCVVPYVCYSSSDSETSQQLIATRETFVPSPQSDQCQHSCGQSFYHEHHRGHCVPDRSKPEAFPIP